MLVPVADMCNHTIRAQISHPRLEEDTSTTAAITTRPTTSSRTTTTTTSAITTFNHAIQCPQRSFVFECLVDVGVGQELQLYYGRLPAIQTLQFYGFVESELLPHEAVQIELEPPDETHEEAEVEGDSDVAVRRLELLDRLGLGLSHFLTPESGVPPKLLASLRVCVLTSAQVCQLQGLGLHPAAQHNSQPRSFPFVPLDQQNEMMALQALTAILEAQVDEIVLGVALPEALAWEEQAAAAQAHVQAEMDASEAGGCHPHLKACTWWPRISDADEAAQMASVNEAIESLRAVYLKCYTSALVHASSLMEEAATFSGAESSFIESAQLVSGTTEERATDGDHLNSDFFEDQVSRRQRIL